MTSINAISSVTTNSSSSSANAGSALSEETIAKLLALGIDINKVSSETEAKKLIEEAEEEQNAQNGNSEADEAETLYNDLKNLGNKLGVDVRKNEDINGIIDKISDRLDEFEESPYNSNLNVFKSELEMLELQYKNMTAGSSAILSAMDLMSQNNRAALGI